MSISKYIREIGRGKDGARALNAEQAQDLMAQVLEGRVTDLEIGAFALAMRIKGETPAELAGFLAATRAFCRAPVPVAPGRAAGASPAQTPAPMASSTSPPAPMASYASTPAQPAAAASPVSATAVWLPSYNGARKLPNLTPLLALLLAQEGVPVLVHGPLAEPGRVTTAEVFQAMGLTIARDAAEVVQAWQRGEPAFMPTEVLCPPLARLLAVRRVVGLRNSGHTVAKVLLPPMAGHEGTGGTDGSVLRVVNHTHPEYADSLTRFLTETRADAMLLRGTEGEPVADARRTPRMDIFLGGQQSETLSVPAREGVLMQLPDLPRSCDAASTASHIDAVMQRRIELPEPIALQVRSLVGALRGEQPPAGATPSNHFKLPHHETIA